MNRASPIRWSQFLIRFRSPIIHKPLPPGEAFRIFAFVELWSIGLAMGPVLVFPPTLPVAVGVGAIFWLLRLIAFRPFTRRTPADAPLLFLALMLPVTLWATPLLQKTIPQVLWLLLGIILYFGIVNWVDTLGRFRLWWTGLVAAGLALAWSTPFITDLSISRLPLVPVSFHSSLHPLAFQTAHANIIAGLLMLLLPLALALFLFGEKPIHWSERLLAAVAFLSMVAMLALTQSRGACLAFFVVISVMPSLRWRWGWRATAATFAGGATAVLLFDPLRFLESALYSSAATSLEGRVEIWSRAMYMIRDFPFTGVGMGLYGKVADALYPFFIAPTGSINHAHNLFLQVAVDLGIPGLIAWSAVLVAGFVQAWRVYRYGRSHQDGFAAGLGAGILGSLLGLAVHGLTDAVPWGTNQPALVTWILLALIAAAGNFYLAGSNAPKKPR